MVLRPPICIVVRPTRVRVDVIRRMSVGDLFREDDCGLGFVTLFDGWFYKVFDLRVDANFG